MAKRVTPLDYGGGPHGHGDPDDKRLHPKEIKLLISQIRRKLVREEYCHRIIHDYNTCALKAGAFVGSLECKDLKLSMEACLEKFNDNEEVEKRAREMYLKDRTLYRKTGISSEQRIALDNYYRKMEENKSKEQASNDSNQNKSQYA